MKTVNIQLLFCILIILIISCNKTENYGKKMQDIEIQTESIDDKIKSIIYQPNSYETRTDLTAEEKKQSDDLDKLRDSLYSEQMHLLILCKGEWYKGRDLPYESILVGLKDAGYNLFNYHSFTPASTEQYKRILNIILDKAGNMEDAAKVKSIIMKTLPFEPEKTRYVDMVWTASRYDIEISQNISGDMLFRFMSKD